MKKILFTTAALVLSSVFAVDTNKNPTDVKYPFLMWSETTIQSFEEIGVKATHEEFIPKLKERTEGAQRLFIIKKDGMTTRDLLKNVRFFEYDRMMMFNHSNAFPDIEGGFTAVTEQKIEEVLGAKPQSFTLESADELSILAEHLAELPLEDGSLKVSVINVIESLPIQIINDVSREVQQSLKKKGEVTSYVMAFTGAPSNGNPEQIVSLLQKGRVLSEVTYNLKQVNPDINNVKAYLYPNTLSGILIMLFVFMMLLIGFLQLMNV